MYCPRCAAQNVNDAKFCRACRADLETVALALADQHLPAEISKEKAKDLKSAEKWLEKRSKGMRNTAQGAILMGTAILMGVALALFSNKADWMIIWTIFFGWLAGWGAILLAFGVGAVLEAGIMLNQIGRVSNQAAPRTAQLASDDSDLISSVPTSPELTSQPSVTEHTTEMLDKQRLRSKQTN